MGKPLEVDRFYYATKDTVIEGTTISVTQIVPITKDQFEEYFNSKDFLIEIRGTQGYAFLDWEDKRDHIKCLCVIQDHCDFWTPDI